MNQQEQRSISDYQLERYLLRELPAADLAAVAREIAADPRSELNFVQCRADLLAIFRRGAFELNPEAKIVLGGSIS